MPQRYESIEAELAANAKKAINNGCWFSNGNGHWMTPEEYVNEGEMDLIINGRDCRRVIIQYDMFDPAKTIQSQIEAMQKQLTNMQQFTKKVFDYWELKKIERQ